MTPKNKPFRTGKNPDKIPLDGNMDTPIPGAYKDYDNDLARDNLENDIPAADLQDL